MVDLSKLKVSLTKHGAHKLAKLIQFHDKDNILNHVTGSHPGINIDHAQVSGILSADKSGNVPDLWNDIRILGEQDIQDIVFIAIVFSHHSLIEAITLGNNSNCDIIKGVTIGGKSFTNFAHIIDQFKLSIEHTPDHVSYDLSRIFYKSYLPEYIREVLQLKLYSAGWDGKGNDVEIGIKHKFNEAFGITANEYRKWLLTESIPSKKSINRVKARRSYPSGIKFKKGHSPKYTGSKMSSISKQSRITFQHNKIQTEVYEILNKIYPEKVGTEVSSNNGSIDIVVKLSEQYNFYEIKTAKSSRENIRQGLSQILEYAYWESTIKIDKLIIIGPAFCDKDTKTYIKFLRDSFGLPIYYQYYNSYKKSLSKLF